MKTLLTLSAVALLFALRTPAFGQASYPGMQLAREAKITLVQARAIALRAVHGKIAAQELERERGGSGLRYSFDVKTGMKTYEVGVDAKDGRILENAPEGKDRD